MIVTTSPSLAADNFLFPVRNHNPFLQVYGLPRFQSGELVATGQTETRVSLDIANHADAGLVGNESAVIDGESYYLNLGWRKGWSERLEIGIDVPLVSHNSGFLDDPIEGWHKLFGLSNGNRNGPQDRLQIYYHQPGVDSFSLESSHTDLGDIQVNGSYALRRSSGGGLALRSSIKLPTGDENRLTGSGAADFSLGLFASDTGLFGLENLGVTAFAGVLLLGDGDVLPELQKESIGFAGLSTSWQINDRLALHGQFYGQSAYYDSKVDEIGGSSLQFAFGTTFHPTGSRLTYSLGVIEDIFSDATTDVAFHFGVTFHARNQPAQR